jgi:hypothetical protein
LSQADQSALAWALQNSFCVNAPGHDPRNVTMVHPGAAEPVLASDTKMLWLSGHAAAH